MFKRRNYNRQAIISSLAGALAIPVALACTAIAQDLHTEVKPTEWAVILPLTSLAGATSGFALYMAAYLPLKRVVKAITNPGAPDDD